VAREAAKQSRRPFLPALRAADRLLDGRGSGAAILLHEGAAEPLGRVLPGSADAVIVGPEGGISDAEVAAAGRAGIPTASLGQQNLRTETAAVAAAAIALHRYGRLG